MVAIPTDVGLRPVNSDARVGEHSAVLWNCDSRTPRSAIRLMFGMSTSPPKQSQRAELTPQVIVDRIEAAKSDADLNTIIDELNAMQTTGPLLFDECVQLIEMANSRRNSLQ